MTEDYKACIGDPFKMGTWVYPETGSPAWLVTKQQRDSATMRKICGSGFTAVQSVWSARTNPLADAGLTSDPDPLAGMTPDSAIVQEINAAVAVAETEYEEQAKRFAEEAKG